MILNYQNIFHTLLLNLFNLDSEYNISQTEIGQGAIHITLMNSSLNNIFVIKGGKTPLFLKQSFVINQDRKEAFENEYQILENLPRINESLTNNLPKPIIPIDALKLVAIHKFIDDSRTLELFINENSGETLDKIFIDLAKVTKQIHSINTDNPLLKKLNKSSCFPFNYNDLENPNFAQKKRFWFLLSKLQTEEFKNFIKSEKVSWLKKKHKTIVHQDFKLNNILINTKDNSPIIIDWEMCGTGDGLWDVATLFFDIQDNQIEEKIIKYLDIFLNHYTSPATFDEVKMKILRYGVLIKLSQLARNSEEQKSLTMEIDKLLKQFK